MQELKIMIVDGSPFSINLIEELLSKNGYKVVAKASNKEEMLEKFLETKPNFITMDLTMPDIDGFESIKLLRKINPDFNSIMISSLKDDDLVRESKKLKINDYLQKPLKEEELLKSIQNVLNVHDNFKLLISEEGEVFRESFKDAMMELSRIRINFADVDFKLNEDDFSFAAVAGITGSFPGRFIIALSEESLSKLTRNVLKDENPSCQQKGNLLAEIANIIAGNACSILNMRERNYKFRLSSPSVFYGKDLRIFSEKENNNFYAAESEFGLIFIATSFSKGDL